MKKRTKIILIISAVVVLLAVALVLLINTVFKDSPSVPPEIEAALVAMVDVEDGELLTEEDLGAFWNEIEGTFDGYYDTMPEGLRKITTTVAARVSSRYEDTISPSCIRADIRDFASGEISFYFSFGTFDYEYRYKGGVLSLKAVTCRLPGDLQIIGDDYNSGGISQRAKFRLNYTLFKICYYPEQVFLYAPSHTESIPTADFAEYMRSVKAIEPGFGRIEERELSLARIEKHMASKRK